MTYNGIILDNSRIKSDKITKLLSYIISHWNSNISVGELSDALWNDEESDNPANALKNLVNSGSFSADSKIKSEASGNIRMDVILSADKKFAAVQLFQFIPYTYQPITSVQYFTDEQASAVIAFLTKSKMQ
jgi:hypothetical protein